MKEKNGRAFASAYNLSWTGVHIHREQDNLSDYNSMPEGGEAAEGTDSGA